jgi:hypothetical protein
MSKKSNKVEITEETPKVSQESLQKSLDLFVNVIEDGDIDKLDEVLDTLYEGTESVDSVDDNMVFSAIENALKTPEELSDQKEAERKEKLQIAKKKYTEDKKIRREVQREYGIRYPKESRHPVVWNVVNDGNYKMFHFVMQFNYTEIYKDGADICPRIVLGQKHFNKKSNQNAFHRLRQAQDRMRELVTDGNPEWIIVSNDTSMITDRNLLARLNTLNKDTVLVGPYGFTEIRSMGKFYNVRDIDTVRGAFAQCSMDNLDWSYLVGKDFAQKDKFRVAILYGPFIAMRYDFFMGIDFEFMAKNTTKGNFHYMADLSMEANVKGKLVGVIKTQCQQYDRIGNYFDDESFINDQMAFVTKWQDKLPISFNN